MSGTSPTGGIPIKGQGFESDSNLKEGGYYGPEFLSSLNPLNDMMGDFIRIVKNSQPPALDSASYSYAMTRYHVDVTADLIASAAKRLAENWKGEQAEAALKTLEKMYDACMQMWDTAENTSRAVSAQANVLREYQSIADTPGLAGADSASKWMFPLPGGSLMSLGKNEAAKYLMHRLNDDTRRSHNHFPESARADFPHIKVDNIIEPPREPGGPKGGGPGSGGGAGGVPGGSFPKGQFPDTHGADPNGLGSDVPRGTIPGSGGSHLPGGSSDLPGTGFPGSGAGGSGTGLAGFSPGGGGLGAGAGGLGAGGAGALDPIGGGAAGGGLSTGSGGLGAAGGLAGRGLGGSGASGSGSRGMMPMAPHGGQGGDEKERERSTWLTEEEDVWSAGDDTAPPVIG